MSETSSARDRKFHSLLIYPSFQLLLLGINTFVIGIVAGVIGWQVRSTYLELSKVGQEAGLSSEHVYFQFLEMQKSLLVQNMVVSAALSIFISSMVMLYLSHRLAGPIVRMQNYLKRTLKTRSRDPLTFRKGDFFPEIPELLNEALGTSGKKSKKKAA